MIVPGIWTTFGKELNVFTVSIGTSELGFMVPLDPYL